MLCIFLFLYPFKREIDEAFTEEELDEEEADKGMLKYGSILGLQYMDKVIKETLRKYPPSPVMPRVCNQDYEIPGSDGIVIPKVIILIIITDLII